MYNYPYIMNAQHQDKLFGCLGAWTGERA